MWYKYRVGRRRLGEGCHTLPRPLFFGLRFCLLRQFHRKRASVFKKWYNEVYYTPWSLLVILKRSCSKLRCFKVFELKSFAYKIRRTVQPRISFEDHPLRDFSKWSSSWWWWVESWSECLRPVVYSSLTGCTSCIVKSLSTRSSFISSPLCADGKIFGKLVTADRNLKASREGSKWSNHGT